MPHAAAAGGTHSAPQLEEIDVSRCVCLQLVRLVLVASKCVIHTVFCVVVMCRCATTVGLQFTIRCCKS